MKKLVYLIVISCFLAACSVFAEGLNSEEMETIFEQKIKLWKESRILKAKPGEIIIYSGEKIKTKEFYDIVALGPDIIPLIIEKRKNNHSLTFLLPTITKAYAKNYFDKGEKVYIWPDYPEFLYTPKHWRKDPNKHAKNIWEYWWDEGRKLTPKLFKKKYDLYVNAQKENDKEKVKYYFEEIKNLGIVAFPQLLTQIQNGDKSLIPIFSYWSDGKVLSNASIADCTKWWEENKNKYKKVLAYPKMK